MNTLIGYTGFVGENLCKKENFHKYNSKNINDLSNIEHETIFCAAPSAEKWKINKDDTEDLKNINSIIKNIKSSKFKKIVLFSTIDVYDKLDGLNEEYNTIYDNHHKYGKNRIYFENEIKKFDNWIIIRLPGLFGKGLKKNIIFDLIFNNITNKINLNDKYQWYSIDWLKSDLDKVIEENKKTFNFFTEPLENSIIINKFFKNINNDYFIDVPSNKKYDLRTKNTRTGYIRGKQEVLESLKSYVNIYK